MSGVALEKALAEKLRELLGSVPWLKAWKVERELAMADRVVDIKATVPLPGGVTAELWVECKADPRPSQFPHVNATQKLGPQGRRRTRVPVFAAPHISPNMAKVCWDHQWSWFDLAGNCRLSVPGAFYLERTGREPVHEPLRPPANLSTPEAARVIRALLAPGNAGRRWTQREMATHFGQLPTPVTEPSLALVNKVVRHLRDEAFIEPHPEGGFRLREPQGLLAAWRDAYRFGRHLRRGYFTLLQGRRLQESLAKLESLTIGHAAYAAFSAAEFQAPHVRQPKTWLYVGAEYEDEFSAAVEAKSVDSGENLVALIPDDDGVFYLREGPAGRLACTNSVQTYVDLCHCGGRGEEAAEALLEQNLKPAWTLHGLR